jgi:hypothetical protein
VSPRRIGQCIRKLGENPYRGHQVVAETRNVRYPGNFTVAGIFWLLSGIEFLGTEDLTPEVAAAV